MFSKRPAWRGALLGLICALLVWLISLTEVMRGLENQSLDGCFAVRGMRSSKCNVVIVAIDDASLDALKKPLMFASPELAEVVNYLYQQEAAVVGVDILVPQSIEKLQSLRAGELGDAEAMGQAVGNAKKKINGSAQGNPIVVLPEFLQPSAPAVLPVFQWCTAPTNDWTNMGFVNLTVDNDMYLRRQRLVAKDNVDDPHACFALAIVGKSHSLPSDWLTNGNMSLDGSPIPLDADDRIANNYVGPPGTIPSVSFQEILDAAKGKGSDAKSKRDWNGKIVLIGVTASAMPDRHATPYANRSLGPLLHSLWSSPPPALMSGTEIHANLVATLEDRAFLTRPVYLTTPLLLLIAGPLLGMALMRLNLEWGAMLTFAHHWLWKLACVALFCYAGWHVEIVPMLVLGILVYCAVFAFRWRWVRNMLGMVKSEAVARALEADPDKLDLRGEEREITVFFSDIRDFTRFSEGHTPQEVVALLNSYFSVVVPIIEAHGGTLNQYMGDGVMVLFGAPTFQSDHALRAVRAARLVVEQIHALADKWTALGFEQLRIGVGIHTGKVIVGTVGSRRRLDYTAIGDTVNTAARIEAANKELRTEILISDATWQAIAVPQRQEFAPLGESRQISMKGKIESLIVYSIDASLQRDAHSEAISRLNAPQGR